MAALLPRLMYYLFPMVDWAFVFVDDFCSTVAPLYALGTPLSWNGQCHGQTRMGNFHPVCARYGNGKVQSSPVAVLTGWSGPLPS